MSRPKYPPTYLIEETDFRNAWAKQIRNCMRGGLEIVANSKAKNPIMTKDINSIIVLTGNAINQIHDRELHPQFPTKGQHLEEYIKTFTYEYLEKHLSLSDKDESKFEYLYIERLAHYRNGEMDQVRMMCDKLRKNGINRQTQMITWEPVKDFPMYVPEEHNPPCLQRVWIRVLEEPVFIDSDDYLGYEVLIPGVVEIHLTWRSRDGFSAWMSNIIAIVHMLEEYVLRKRYIIVKFVDYVDAFHIYEPDWENANKINIVPVNPQFMR